MPGLDDLYREIILDHYRTPRNRGDLPVPPARHAEGHNPLCGDEVTVFLQVDDVDGVATVSDVKVTGQGCSISQSSASMMTQAVKGKPVADAEQLFHRFKAMMGVEERAALTDDEVRSLGDLAALQGVVKFPVRIKCATLAWNTLDQALHES